MRRELPMILIRVIVGAVFLIEGALKFLLPGDYGVGRFTQIGLPVPDILASTVGGVEIVGGLAVMLNFYAGDAALALLVVIVTALITTKLPILLGHRLGLLSLVKLPRYGWMSFLHEARLDFMVLFALVAVLIDSGIRIGRRRRWYQGS